MSDNNGFAGGYGNGQQNGGSYDPNMNYGAQGQQGYQDPYGYGQGYQNQDYQNQGYDAQGYQPGYQSQQGYDTQGYQPGYQGQSQQGYQPGYQSQQGYEPQGYQQGYDAQGYQDQGYQDQGYQAQGYQDQQDYSGQAFGTPGQEQAASASSSASLDDEWFNNILGVDGAGEVVDDGGQFGFSAPQAPAPQQAFRTSAGPVRQSRTEFLQTRRHRSEQRRRQTCRRPQVTCSRRQRQKRRRWKKDEAQP